MQRGVKCPDVCLIGSTLNNQMTKNGLWNLHSLPAVLYGRRLKRRFRELLHFKIFLKLNVMRCRNLSVEIEN